MNKYMRIETLAASYIFETDSEETALLRFANVAGYDSYAELADTVGKSVDEAKADLVISHVTADDLVRDIVEKAVVADVIDNWTIRDLSSLHGLDEKPLVAAAREMLSRRLRENYDASVLSESRLHIGGTANLDQVYSALILVHGYYGDDGMGEWQGGGTKGTVPTFGPEPVGASGLISWDAERVLVQDENVPGFSISIEPRLDVAA